MINVNVGRNVKWARYSFQVLFQVLMQFWTPDDEHLCSKLVEAWNKTYCETKILCINLVKYWDKCIVLVSLTSENIKFLPAIFKKWEIACALPQLRNTTKLKKLKIPYRSWLI